MLVSNAKEDLLQWCYLSVDKYICTDFGESA